MQGYKVLLQKLWRSCNGQKKHTLNNNSKNADDVNIIVDALNARTTIFHDPASPMDGEYNCNGRDMLMTTLHRTKPLDASGLAIYVRW